MQRFIHKHYITIAIIVFALFAIFHLLTLSISPLVWGDEVCFNAITRDYAQHGTYFNLADRTAYGGKIQLTIYGPVFFIINSWIIHVFGNTIFFFRIIGAIAGLGISLLFFKYFKNFLSLKYIFIAWFVALMADPFIMSSMHKGRMDVLAIFFYLVASLLLFKSEKNITDKPFLKWLLSAIFFSLSVLTTSRILVLCFPFAALFIYYLIQTGFNKKILFYILTWGFITVGSYTIWIFSAYGSIQYFIEYINILKSAYPEHFSGGIFIPLEVKPIVALAIIFYFFACIFSKKLLFNEIYLFVFIFILSFYSFVGETGPYAVLIEPVYYILILISLRDILSLNKKPSLNFATAFILLLLTYNFLLFGIKNIALIDDYAARDYTKVNEFVSKNIKPGSKVVNDDLYYYAVINSNSQSILTFNLQRNFNIPETYAREVYDYDYLIISERLKKTHPELIDLYLANSKLVEVASYKSPHSRLTEKLTQLSKLTGKLSQFGVYTFSVEGYDGIIYKRIKN